MEKKTIVTNLLVLGRDYCSAELHGKKGTVYIDKATLFQYKHLNLAIDTINSVCNSSMALPISSLACASSRHCLISSSSLICRHNS